MFQIGILGSDNSHALQFAKLCNLPDQDGNFLYDDVRISAIYGLNDDPAHTKAVASDGAIPYIAGRPEELFGRVDAVMVVYRNGKYHVDGILPFVERGMPVWIDKPICVSLADISRLKRAVEEHKVLVTGGSTIKYNYDILSLVSRIQSGALGEIAGGSMNFPGDLSSEYEGLFFYGSHLWEMCLVVFGYDVQSVYAESASCDNTLVIAGYRDKKVALNFNAKSKNHLISVLGTKDSAMLEMDISSIYRLGFDRFVHMLRTRKMPLSFDQLVKPVVLLNAVQRSLVEKRQVSIEEMTI